jgi:pyridoxal phosphate enzyme (YggS family)
MNHQPPETRETSLTSEHARLRENLEALERRIARACERAARPRSGVRLIAVTKTHPVAAVQALIDIGIHDLGENRVTEIEEKTPLLRGDFTMHMIGHLQTNKVGRVLPHVAWLQSIDRERLVSRIESCHSGNGRLKALVEVNTSGEESKSGCLPGECEALCERVRAGNALEFRGLMTIGPLGASEKTIRESFALLRKLAETCAVKGEPLELSMGMSGDFEWAIEEGATMIRVGSALLGERPR